MFVDYIFNGKAGGEVAQAIQGCHFDPGYMRPFVEDGEKYVSVNSGETEYNEYLGADVPKKVVVPVRKLIERGINMPVFNATLGLRRDQWRRIDDTVREVKRRRLRAWGDLASVSNVTNFDGMSTTIMEHETMTDEGETRVDMDGLSEGRNYEAQYQLEGTPLPITHAGFFHSLRMQAVSSNRGTPLSTTKAAMATRRVAETIEKTLIGTQTGITYGLTADYGRSPTVFGYTNFPARATKTDMTAPDGTNGPAVLTSWLALRDLLYDNNHFGPFIAYTSTDYDQYLDNLFSTSEPSAGTLRSRLLQIDGINAIRRLDYLTNTFTVVLVEMTPETAEAITGMDVRVIQWESKGGWQLNFKVVAIMAPRLFADANDNCGIAHGTTS